MAVFENKIDVDTPEVAEEEKLIKDRLFEVVGKLKRIDPSRYGGIDPGKLTPDNPLFSEVRRATLRTVKPEMLEKKIEEALGKLEESPNYEKFYNERLGKFRSATAEGTPVADLRERERELRKRLFSAPAEAREKYKDIFDPFARERLAEQFTGQLASEAEGVRELRAPELSFLSELPSLAKGDLEEQRHTLAEKLQNLRTLYSKALDEAGGLQSEYEQAVGEERRKKPSGGGETATSTDLSWLFGEEEKEESPVEEPIVTESSESSSLGGDDYFDQIDRELSAISAPKTVAKRSKRIAENFGGRV